MTASARIVSGEYYHLYNRGNHRDPIFHQPRDYERFLWSLSDAAAIHGVTIYAYCLMPNHFHSLVRQRVGGSLTKMMRSFVTSYAMYYNRAYGNVGHVFQGRYKARRIENTEDLLWLTRYIHRNPIEFAPMDTYHWSSYRAYAYGEPNNFCESALIRQVFADTYACSYATFCAESLRSDLPAT